MSGLKLVRYVAWTGVAVFALIFGMLTLGWYWTDGGASRQVELVQVGGDFELTDTEGNRVTRADLSGRPSLFFFGFTYCPDVCPTTLYEASSWLDALEGQADEVNVVFVSVDPERDTPDVMKRYLASFDERIIGLTGTPEEIEAVTGAYRVHARKVDLEDGAYTVDHTASVYMMDENGDFVGTIGYGEAPEMALEKIRRLIRA